MYWYIRKQLRQFLRRFRGDVDFDKSFKAQGRSRILYYMFAWTIGTVTFMHFLFGMRDPETGEWLWVDPKDMKYIGVPGYEVNATGLSGFKFQKKKVPSTVPDDD